MKARKRLVAVASAGGHFVQLLRMAPAFSHHEVIWVTTNPDLVANIPGGYFETVRDASMWNKSALVVMAFQVTLLMMRHRPDVVITTGAAPGFFAIVLGRLLRARTIWIDSVANAAELSLAGRKAASWADHWYTQWPELAKPNGPHYMGAVF